jgi:hypothetical protein
LSLNTWSASAPIARRHLSPGAFEGGARGSHRRIDILRRGRRDLGDHLFGRRVDDLDRLAAGGVAPLAVDEELSANHTRRWHKVIPSPIQHKGHEGHKANFLEKLRIS